MEIESRVDGLGMMASDADKTVQATTELELSANMERQETTRNDGLFSQNVLLHEPIDEVTD